MVFAYYSKLSPARQRTYRASDALAPLLLDGSLDLGAIVARSAEELALERRAHVQRACQALLDTLITASKVPPLKVKVYAARRAPDWGELHGRYDADDDEE